MTQVFELLNSLSLPGFTLGNWQSKIRDRVNVHERYERLRNWDGRRETTDLVYQDQNSSLTQLLIGKGYLSSAWTGRSPEYFIEVKTTLGSLDNTFYCSQNQCDLMGEMELVNSAPSDKVYLIARVFSLSDSGMGLKLYMDPATLKKQGMLFFKADKYSVTAV
jgi:hypothetical protein